MAEVEGKRIVAEDGNGTTAWIVSGMSARQTWWCGVLMFLMLLGGIACSSTSNKHHVAGSPTTTLTPSGDILRIDDEVVQHVLIPDPSQGPLYALTDQALYVHENGVWLRTRTANDGRAFLVDPTTPERLFRGNHPVCGLPDQKNAPIALEVSHDGGMNWRDLGQGDNILPLALDSADPAVLYGTDCALAISPTNGNTWMHLDPMPQHSLAALIVDDERLLLLGTRLDGSGQLIDVDVANPREPEIGQVLLDEPGLACLDAHGSRIAVGGNDTVHISDDSGLSWVSSRIGLEAVTASGSPEPGHPSGAAPAEDVGILTVKLGLGDSHRIYVGTPHGLFISQDDGNSWDRYDVVPTTAHVTEIQLGLDGADLYVTTDDGVMVVPAP